jgi:hypothetical protein
MFPRYAEFIFTACFAAKSACAAIALAISANGYCGWCTHGHGTVDEVSNEAIRRCQKLGGVDVHIVATSWYTGGFAALAKSGSGKDTVWGWAIVSGISGTNALTSTKAYQKQTEEAAIALCRKRGD